MPITDNSPWAAGGTNSSGFFLPLGNLTILFSFKLPTKISPCFDTAIPSGKKLSSKNKDSSDIDILLKEKKYKKK